LPVLRTVPVPQASRQFGVEGELVLIVKTLRLHTVSREGKMPHPVAVPNRGRDDHRRFKRGAGGGAKAPMEASRFVAKARMPAGGQLLQHFLRRQVVPAFVGVGNPCPNVALEIGRGVGQAGERPGSITFADDLEAGPFGGGGALPGPILPQKRCLPVVVP